MSEVFLHLTEERFVLLLAFIGGYIDAAGYLKCLGVFTTSITGNLVVACSSVTTMRGVICRSIVCIAFTGAAGVGAALALRLKLAHRFNARWIAFVLLLIETLILVAVLILGLLIDDTISNTTDLDNWSVILIGSLLAISMGFHNVAAKEAVANCPPTTVMTSTLVNVAQNAANTIEYSLASYACLRLTPLPNKNTDSSDDDARQEQNQKILASMAAKCDDSFGKLRTTSKPLLSFIVGAIIGAVVMFHGTFWCLFFPIGLVSGIMVDIIMKETDCKTKATASASSPVYKQVAASSAEVKAKEIELPSASASLSPPSTSPSASASASSVSITIEESVSKV